MLKHRLLLLTFFCFVLAVPLAQAQTPQPDLAGLSAEETTMLNQINRSRLRDNLVHLVPNPALTELARSYAADLAARPLNALGDVFVARDGRNLEALLREVGYGEYPGGYVADFVPIILRDFGPEQMIDYWYRNYIDVDLRSRRMIREGEPLLPVFSPLYREIGLAANFNQTTERYYYVMIFAAQPNVLPVVVAEQPDLNVIATRVDTREVILYVHDERANRFGTETTIGAIEYLRISDSPQALECGTDRDQGWRPYENEIRWLLADTPGPQTLYVQMCDARGQTLMTPVQVSYLQEATPTPVVTQGVDGQPTPDVLGIANATQTAAASATAFAPYLVTVEAILTATAAAPTPTP